MQLFSGLKRGGSGYLTNNKFEHSAVVDESMQVPERKVKLSASKNIQECGIVSGIQKNIQEWQPTLSSLRSPLLQHSTVGSWTCAWGLKF